jgi:hypothetical protein
MIKILAETMRRLIAFLRPDPLRMGFLALSGVIIYLPVVVETEPTQPSGESPMIAELTWAPADTIERAAQGSDNFPITWADDGNLYTAYGDGRGFEQEAPQKLSLGFARVSGPPTDFEGVNIPSEDEQIGNRENGKKASGMLMVDGVLYMWVRNANNDGEGCQLASSTDRAQSWIWSDWIFPEFGYCTFINYGQNYAGARDNYVYMVTHDHPSAYEGARQFILTRVPKDAIMDRSRYEFFVELAPEPVWSTDIAARGPVFSHTEELARRSSITYNAGLGRYLWWQGFPHSGDERYEGGFAVYDAPEPWGPWTTVYSTEEWDVGPGETGTFPTKWMSADGRELYLVFSGNDAFSVRKATLTLR